MSASDGGGVPHETDCISSDGPSITAMQDAAVEVTLATLRRNCAGVREWEQAHGYSTVRDGGLYLANDWAVSYHKSTYRGRPCYYIRWSAIEHIWVKR